MYILSGIEIRSPNTFDVQESVQMAQQRTLGGRVGRDYFGTSKRVWSLEYQNVNKSDYDTMKSIYDAYIANATAVAWEVTESNYTISATTVHVDLVERSFRTKGTDYLSDFNLVLTEA